MHLFGPLAATTSQADSVLQALLSTMGHLFPVFALVGILALVLKVLKRPSVKGRIGEAVVNWGGLSRLDRTTYAVLKNVFVPSISGKGTTEIDHVVVSVHGIFVIETKNYGGWIFGSEHDRMWTRSDHGRKRQFLNPLVQNKLHIDSLAAFLGLPRSAFHSVIFIVGDAKLKTPMPSNVLTSGLVHHIELERRLLLTKPEATEACKRLSEHDSGMDKRAMRRAHAAQVSARAPG